MPHTKVWHAAASLDHCAWSQEGLPTVCLGVWIWMTLAPTPADAKFLGPLERDHVAKQVKQNKVMPALSVLCLSAAAKHTGAAHSAHKHLHCFHADLLSPAFIRLACWRSRNLWASGTV